jgi:pyrimidine operon attenuation protein / uracil phosphoribosyltransferase
MGKNNMADDKLLLNGAEMNAIIDKLADEISNEFSEKSDYALIGIQLRGVLFAERLVNLIEKKSGFRPEMGSLDINMYRDDIGMKDGLPVIRETDIPFDINDKDVILVDDVLATGRTIRAALDALTDYGRPGLIRLAVMVDRDNREFPIRADYAGTILKGGGSRRVNICWQEIHGEDCVKEVEWEK